MQFDDAKSYKLSTKINDKFYSKDELAVFLHTFNLSYRYVPLSSKKGMLELFNDLINISFKVTLYD